LAHPARPHPTSQARASYIDTAFAMAETLSLRPETTYDAVLLMDRVMATGTSLTDGLSRLFVAAALRVRARAAGRAAADARFKRRPRLLYARFKRRPRLL
jgi:hypothetical protein